MALKLDKDAILELLGRYKDQLFLVLLVVASGYGGWYLYEMSSRTVGEMISDRFEVDTGGPVNGPGGDEIVSTEVAEKLTAKEAEETYNLESNPFGSPQDQLRIRQQVEAYYKQGIELYEEQRFQESVAMFDKVIELDVTETRIQYPIPPSEYKRRAQSQDAKLNFDRILNSAQSEEAEGDRLAGEGDRREALNAYSRASKLVTDVLDANPDLPQQNLDQLREVQTSVDQKLRDLQRTIILDDIDQAAQEGQNVLQGNDLVAHIQASFRLNQLQIQINQIDPNAQLIEQSARARVNGLLQRLQSKLKDNFQQIIVQAESQFTTAMQEQDPIKAQEAIFALTQAMNYLQQGQDPSIRQEIISKRNGFIQQRAQLVISKAQTFLQEQTQILNQEDYENFDPQTKFRYLQNLNQLLESGGSAIPAESQQTIQSLMKQLNALTLPPPVTEAYKIISIKPVSPTSKSYSVQYIDLSSRTQNPTSATWRDGSMDRRTRITMKVDTDRGVVILSKPGYTDAEVPLSASEE